MAASNTQRRARSKPQPVPEDDEDSVALGTDVAIAAMQAMIMSGMDPVEAAAKCWALPHVFLETRAEWIEAMEERYGADG